MEQQQVEDAVVEDNKMKFQILKKKSTNLLFMLLFLTLITITACSSSQGPGKYDTFAKALTEEGVKMYGTEWCSHCKNQKELFGNSFQYINYIDCDEESYLCQSAGVKGFPTWEIDGQLYPGEQSLEDLSLYSGVEFVEG